jgi:hypothetical protein
VRLRDHLRGTKEIPWHGKAIRLVEEGRRVHGTHLMHDVMVCVATTDPVFAFRRYISDIGTSWGDNESSRRRWVMTCPRCTSSQVVTKNRPYLSAYLSCLRCDYKWRLVRGRVVPA